VQREPVDVNEAIRDVIILLRSEAYRYSVAIHTALTEDLPQVMADRVQVQQVLTNLILNAIQAMKGVDAAREVTVRSERAENSHLLISVSDTGVGFAPQHADQIFKLKHFSLLRPRAPAWDYRSAAQLLRPTAGGCGPRPTPGGVRPFISLCPAKSRRANECQEQSERIHCR